MKIGNALSAGTLIGSQIRTLYHLLTNTQQITLIQMGNNSHII